MKKICNICGKQLSHTTKGNLCYSCFVVKNREETIKHWLETGETGCNVSTTLRNAIRDYISTMQHDKCAICGIENKWNGKVLKFVLDHIDGDASNNFQDNLRLICPNCDSQLPTFKARNKKSARNYRSKYYKERYSSG